MARFIEFTKTNGEPAFINPEAVSAVAKKDGVTVIYLMGDSSPFEVQGTVDETVMILSED